MRINRRFLFALALTFVLAVVSPHFTQLGADEVTERAGAPAADQPAVDEAVWQKVFREMAAQYEIVAAGDVPRKFVLRPAPVLRWNQPVRIADGGAVYVWLDEGRPAVIATLFAWPFNGKPVVAHEMHALTLAPMRASYEGKEVWSLDKPALEFKRVPRAPAPGQTATQRLAQMRTIGREFSAKSIDRKEGEWELRLLGQPLYRYELKAADAPKVGGDSQARVETRNGAETRAAALDGGTGGVVDTVLDGVLDGAILAFVQGTDPEILLLLEARRDEGQYYWNFALARFSDYRLVVKHKDTEVWRVDASTQNDRHAPYFIRSLDHFELPAKRDKQQ